MKKNSKKHKLKVFKLQSSWEVQDKMRRVELWRLMNGKDEHELIPMGMFKEIHSGDLMLAFRKHLIAEKQIFHVHCKIMARNDETGEQVNVDYEASLRQQVTIWQFLEGSDSSYPDEVIYKDNGGGLKTRWMGFHHELEAYLDTIGDDDYTLVSNHCTMTIHTAFKSRWHEQQFYLAKGSGATQFLLPINRKK